MGKGKSSVTMGQQSPKKSWHENLKYDPDREYLLDGVTKMRPQFNISVWERELETDYDKEFILGEINSGVHLVNTHHKPKPCFMENYPSAKLHAEQVEAEIKKELAEGRYSIVTEKPDIVSAMGAIPKSDGTVRIIHDCSRPAGSAVNDYSIDCPKQKYQSIRDAIKAISPGCYLAKVDLKGAFRSCALNKSQYPFMGLHWTFSGDKRRTYIQERYMCFGSRAAPSIFHRFSQAVRRMMARRGGVIIAYQDDFLVIGKTKQQCLNIYRELISLLRELGFSIAWSKLVDPTQVLVFLGVQFDTRDMSISLPQEKIRKLYDTLCSFSSRIRASRRQLQKLAGKLAYAAHVVVEGGRTYLQRIFDMIGPLQRPNHKARLTAGFKADISFWLSFLETFNCKRMLNESLPEIHIYTDACNHGGGMVSPFDWSYFNWASDLPSLQHAHINVKESATALLAMYRLAPFLANSNVVIHSDNKTTEAILNKGACHDETLMYLLRGIFWLSKGFHFNVRCEYVPGSLNHIADSISRIHAKGHMLYWYSVISNARPFTVPLFMSLCQGHMSSRALFSLLQTQPSEAC